MENCQPLSYLCLKIVVEYMNSNQRALYMSRLSPSINKSIPLHLKYLQINYFGFIMDNLDYSFDHPSLDMFECSMESPVEQGDLLVRNPESRFSDLGRTKTVETWFIDWKTRKLKAVRSKAKIEDVKRNQIKRCFGDCLIHYVDHLEIGNKESVAKKIVLRLPLGFKLHVHQFQVHEQEHLIPIFQALQPLFASPPVELLLRVETPTDPIFQNDFLSSFESLNILSQKSDEDWFGTVCSLRNKRVCLGGDGPIKMRFMEIIQQWRENKRPLGSKLSIKTELPGAHLDALQKGSSSIKSTIPGKTDLKYPYGYIVKLDDDTELCLYITNDFQCEHFPFDLKCCFGSKSCRYVESFYFVMEVVPAGSGIPIEV